MSTKILEKLLPLLCTLIELIIARLKKVEDTNVGDKVARIEELAQQYNMDDSEKMELIDFV